MYEKLKEAAHSKGISIGKLARMSDIASPDMYSAINGNKPMYPNWRKRIAAALDTDEAELFEEDAENG